MIDSELPTDLRRPCTPSHPRKSAPHHRDFLGTPGLPPHEIVDFARTAGLPPHEIFDFARTPGLPPHEIFDFARTPGLPPHEIFDFARTPGLRSSLTQCRMG